jgi:tetratricopeptide (TPR) repeat protein
VTTFLRLLTATGIALALAGLGAAQQGGETVDIPGAKPARPSGPAKRPASGPAKTTKPAAALVNALPPPENRVAVLIGVDGLSKEMSGAANDAQSLADVLHHNADFPKSHVALALSAQATREGILQTIGTQTVADGLLLFYFAGPSVEIDGVVYLLPSGMAGDAAPDAIKQGGISAAELKDRLVATGAKQILIILDTCRNDPDNESPAAAVVSRAYAQQFSLAHNNLKAHALFLPSIPGQAPYVMSGRGRGYLTAGIVEGLKGGAATRKGEVTLRRLAIFAREWVAQRLRDDYEKQQTPDIDIAGYRENDVVVSHGYAPLGDSTITALNTEPDDPDFVAGEEAMGRSDFAAAAEAYTRIASRTPDNPYVHARLSFAFQGLRNYADAARELERAVDLDPTKSDWLTKLGQIYFTQLDDPEHARGAFERALAVDPSPRLRSDLGIVLFELGNRAYKQGKFDEAAAAFARAREVNAKIAPDVAPMLARAYSRIGAIHLTAGRLPEAIDVFAKAVEADATNVDAQVGLGTAHLKSGDVAAARRVAERLATINAPAAANLQTQIDATAPATPPQ